MYKTININTQIYQKLNTIAARLNKPKAKIIEFLINNYTDSLKEQEQKELKKFNQEMKATINNMQFSKKIQIKSTDLNQSFDTLKDIDLKSL